jgi:hypothetical protein
MKLDGPREQPSIVPKLKALNLPGDGPKGTHKEPESLTSNLGSPEKTGPTGGASPTAIDMLRAAPRSKNSKALFDEAVQLPPPKRALGLLAAFSSYETLPNDQSKVTLVNSSVVALEQLKEKHPAATPNSYMQRAVDKLTEIAGKLGPDDREKVKERIDASKKILLTEEKFAPDSHNIGGRTQRWMA